MHCNKFIWATFSLCYFSERWWEEEPQLDLFDEVTVRPGECTLDQMKEALEGVIFADLLPLSTSGDITVSGIVSTRIAYIYSMQVFLTYTKKSS